MKLNKKFKFIAWGHSREHGSTHTHGYIHRSYADAFAYLGYESYCKPDIYDNNFDYSNTLFLTEWQEADNLPIRDDCFYIFHNCGGEKYKALIDAKRAINLGVYTDDVLNHNFSKKDECIYYDVNSSILFMPWATNLMPDEIETNKPNKIFNDTSKMIYWVGTVGAGEGGNINEIQPFMDACQHNGIQFMHGMNIDRQRSIQLIKNSYMAPTITGTWQSKVGYIPCRIFKNISYGQFGITNSSRVNSLFNNRLIFNTDTYQLFNDATIKLPQLKLNDLHELMDEVKNKHTFLNRVQTILEFIVLVNPSLIGSMVDE